MPTLSTGGTHPLSARIARLLSGFSVSQVPWIRSRLSLGEPTRPLLAGHCHHFWLLDWRVLFTLPLPDFPISGFVALFAWLLLRISVRLLSGFGTSSSVRKFRGLLVAYSLVFHASKVPQGALGCKSGVKNGRDLGL